MWRCRRPHQNRACESPLEGNAPGPTEQTGSPESSGLTQLPAGPPCSPDLSLSGPKSLSPGSFHSPPTLKRGTRLPAPAGQTPPSGAELLEMGSARGLELVRQTPSHLPVSSRPDALKAAPASISLLHFVLFLICGSSYCWEWPKVKAALHCIAHRPGSPGMEFQGSED